MDRLIVALLLVALAILSTSPSRAAEAPVRIAIVGTDPSVATELAPRDALYLHVRYASDVPFRLQARGYKDGVEQQASMMNPSPVYPAGQGEAIAWLAFDAGLVDEVRVLAFDERWQPVSDARLERSVLWSRTAATVDKRAGWVDALNAYQQSSVSLQAKAATPPTTAGDVVLLQFMALSVPGYLVLQALALWLRRGRGKWPELAPLVVMAPMFAFAAIAYARDANLWPIWLLFLCPVACVFLVLVLVARRLAPVARAT